MPINKKAPKMQGFIQSLFRKCYCDLTNNILILESVNLISYLIFDGEIGDAECIDVT